MRPSGGRATSSRLRWPATVRTVRFRLTLWYSSVLLVFGLAFVLALNIAARMDPPRVFVVQGVELRETEFEARRQPGGALSPLPPSSALTPALIVQQAEDQIYEENLDRLRRWSLIAVAGLVFASATGGYIVSGVLLRPVRDITRAASEIGATNLSRRINHQGVEDEMKELADTFDSMIGRLEQAFLSQQRFVQDASHELRTPLAAIRTNIEVAEMEPDASIDDYHEIVGLVKGQTDRLARLADDLQMLTGEGGQPELETFELEPMAKEVFRQLAALAARNRVQVTVDIPPGCTVTASPDWLFRCITNLVDNAVKYSEEGSSVLVSTETDKRLISIIVTDNGPGIPADALPHVFDRFYRVDKGRSRREGGSGLGLAIVKELAEKMGGSTGASSTLGEGATFSITLPRHSSGEVRQADDKPNFATR
ncbi:MAG TPA: HAMP domain-containing sensor histidine kinase [Dehalococcoidia bacterium]|nr:HAMP domain-containing sensor histidine kinase [Dehalococcoidia bacterium]